MFIIIGLVVLFYAFRFYMAYEQKKHFSFGSDVELLKFVQIYNDETELNIIKKAEAVNCDGQLYCLNSKFLESQKKEAGEFNSRKVSFMNGMVDVIKLEYEAGLTSKWPIVKTEEFFNPNSKYLYIDGSVADHDSCLQKAGNKHSIVYQYYDYFNGVPYAFSSSTFYNVKVYTIFDINQRPVCRAIVADDQSIS